MKQSLENLKRNLSCRVVDIWGIMSYGFFERFGMMPPIDTCESGNRTSVDSYWGDHTVHSKPFITASQSRRYLEWRFSVYPLFREFMQLYGEHEDHIILDYGCGPGNDLVGFATNTNARRVIGIDVSEKALRLAQHRLALHRVDPKRIKLILTSDLHYELPFEDNSIDYIHCAGVLHHVSQPELVLKEFNRVLKNDSIACIMVYNYHSLWLHLFTAYEKMIVKGAFSGLSLQKAFSKNTDGEECPLSRCYRPKEFISLCKKAGFEGVEYVGGYLSDTELKSLHTYGQKALEDENLGEEQKEFLRSLKFDRRSFPKYKEKHAGIGGVYRLRKVSFE